VRLARRRRKMSSLRWLNLNYLSVIILTGGRAGEATLNKEGEALFAKKRASPLAHLSAELSLRPECSNQRQPSSFVPARVLVPNRIWIRIRIQIWVSIHRRRRGPSRAVQALRGRPMEISSAGHVSQSRHYPPPRLAERAGDGDNDSDNGGGGNPLEVETSGRIKATHHLASRAGCPFCKLSPLGVIGSACSWPPNRLYKWDRWAAEQEAAAKCRAGSPAPIGRWPG